MTLTLTKGAETCALELPATDRCVSVRGFMIPVDMIAAVRMDVADKTMGVPAIQCVSNPMERGSDE